MATKPFESRIQDLVYNVDVGIGLLLIKYGLYILFIFLSIALYTATQFKGFKEAEAMEYAQLGRNLIEQKSLTTRAIRPAGMWYLIRNEKGNETTLIEQHPDILHPPAWPAVLGVWFKITGQKFSTVFKGNVFPAEYAIVTLNWIFSILTVLMLYLIGLRFFEKRVALIATTLFFLSDLILGMAISGLNISMLMFLNMLMFYSALKATEHREEGRAAWTWMLPMGISALCCVAGFLTRYSAIAMLPALILWYALNMKKAWVSIGVVVAVFIIGISPWLVRNVAVSGGVLGLAPYTALSDSDAFPADSFDRSLSIDLETKEIGTALKSKWLGNLSQFYSERIPSMDGSILAGLFLVSFFYRFVKDPVHRLRWCMALLGFILTLIAAFFGEGSFRAVYIIWPFAILYATGFFFLLLDRLQFQVKVLNVLVIVAFMFASSLPVVFAILPPRAAVPYPPYFPPFITYATNMIKSGELLCSDMPWATAWYGGKNTLLLPTTIDEFYEINDYTKRVSGIYFTTITRDKPFVRTLVTGPDRDWFPIIEGRIPGDFPLTQGVPLNGLDQVFLTDRTRWEE